MSQSKKLTGVGFAPAQAKQVLGDVDSGPVGVAGITATGTTQATAITLGAGFNFFAAVPAGSGCILPAAGDVGDTQRVFNYSGTTLNIYPPLGGSINNGTVNAPVTVAANAYSACTAIVNPLTGTFTGLNFATK